MTDHVVNVEQAEQWDGQEGAHWAENTDRYDALSQRLTPHLLDSAEVAPSDRVLDIGCGCGLTTRAVARIANAGSVLGVDLSAPMLRQAQQRTDAEGLTNVRFEQADAQVHSFQAAHFDLAISRFGVMFFQDPAAAFTNIVGAIRPGGRVLFLCWQDLLRNDWIMVPAGAALSSVPFPDLGPEGAPGPFSLADPDRIGGVLTNAGFTGVDVTELTEQVYLGANAGDATRFLMGTGMARVLLEGASEETETNVFDAVRSALGSHEQPEGIWLGSAAWLVKATVPEAQS